ncbi:MAG: hypothetical protein ACI36Z_01360 [Alloprevotella sp.]
MATTINEGLTFFVTPSINRFVALHEGLAYWFKTKDQYLYKVSTEREFYEYNGDSEVPDKLRYTPTQTGFVSLRGLMAKRRYYVTHPVNAEGKERTGVELVKQKYHEM